MLKPCMGVFWRRPDQYTFVRGVLELIGESMVGWHMLRLRESLGRKEE